MRKSLIFLLCILYLTLFEVRQMAIFLGNSWTSIAFHIALLSFTSAHMLMRESQVDIGYDIKTSIYLFEKCLVCAIFALGIS